MVKELGKLPSCKPHNCAQHRTIQFVKYSLGYCDIIKSVVAFGCASGLDGGRGENVQAVPLFVIVARREVASRVFKGLPLDGGATLKELRARRAGSSGLNVSAVLRQSLLFASFTVCPSKRQNAQILEDPPKKICSRMPPEAFDFFWQTICTPQNRPPPAPQKR
jgi:hypothetical protein